jgi:hypothetical protein
LGQVEEKNSKTELIKKGAVKGRKAWIRQGLQHYMMINSGKLNFGVKSGLGCQGRKDREEKKLRAGHKCNII